MKIGQMSARVIAIHGNEMSGERRANLEIKSECPALVEILFSYIVPLLHIAEERNSRASAQL